MPATPRATPDERAAGRVIPARAFDLPSLRSMDADVQVAIDELDLGSDKVEPLRALRAHVLLRQAVLPPPLNLPVEVWGQSRDEWLARRR